MLNQKYALQLRPTQGVCISKIDVFNCLVDQKLRGTKQVVHSLRAFIMYITVRLRVGHALGTNFCRHTITSVL